MPQYRDLNVGRYLFIDEAEFFRRRGVTQIVSFADTEAHAEYLRRIGFQATGDGCTYRLSV